jgi:hypothetical protein
MSSALGLYGQDALIYCIIPGSPSHRFTSLESRDFSVNVRSRSSAATDVTVMGDSRRESDMLLQTKCVLLRDEAENIRSCGWILSSWLERIHRHFHSPEYLISSLGEIDSTK